MTILSALPPSLTQTPSLDINGPNILFLRAKWRHILTALILLLQQRTHIGWMRWTILPLFLWRILSDSKKKPTYSCHLIYFLLTLKFRVLSRFTHSLSYLIHPCVEVLHSPTLYVPTRATFLADNLPIIYLVDYILTSSV